MLLGNKCDMEDKRVVPKAKGEQVRWCTPLTNYKQPFIIKVLGIDWLICSRHLKPCSVHRPESRNLVFIRSPAVTNISVSCFHITFTWQLCLSWPNSTLKIGKYNMKLLKNNRTAKVEYHVFFMHNVWRMGLTWDIRTGENSLGVGERAASCCLYIPQRLMPSVTPQWQLLK